MHIEYRTPTITSIGGRAGSVRSADGHIDLHMAVPKEMGGPGGNANPEELFAAGYAACLHAAVKRVAADTNIAIGHSTVEARIGLGADVDGPGFRITAELHVTLPAADATAAQDVVCAAHRVCPYSKATRNNIDLKLSVTAADGHEYVIPVAAV